MYGDKWIAESPLRFYAIAGATYVYFPAFSSMQMELIDRILPHTNFKFSNMHHDIGLFRVTIMCIYKLYVENKINERNKKKRKKKKKKRERRARSILRKIPIQMIRIVLFYFIICHSMLQVLSFELDLA